MIRVAKTKMHINLGKNRRLIILGVAAVGLLGAALVFRSLAATSGAELEAESATVSGKASKVTDASLSGGGALHFGEITGGNPNPTPNPTPGTLPQIPDNPVPSLESDTFDSSGDIADDTAIYANPTDPAKSVVIGDNKSDSGGGIGVFSMQGKLLQFRPDGKIGNVDLRSGFSLGGKSIVLVGANNRSKGTMTFWEYNPSSQQLSEPIANISAVTPNYGFCMYHSAKTGKFYAFVTQETGSSTMEQYELSDSGGKLQATKVRNFSVGSITEGCVADDELGKLYVAQEDKALWRYDAEPEGGDARTAIGDAGDGHLTADIEGVSIAKGPNNTGYIVVSSQGDSRYAVYDRQTNAFIRNFKVGSSGSIDSAEGTDGLDISTANLGPGFEKGMLIVHDESNDGSGTSNYKFIPLQ